MPFPRYGADENGKGHLSKHPMPRQPKGKEQGYVWEVIKKIYCFFRNIS